MKQVVLKVKDDFADSHLEIVANLHRGFQEGLDYKKNGKKALSTLNDFLDNER